MVHSKKQEARVGAIVLALLFACASPFLWRYYREKSLVASVQKLTMAQVRAQTAHLRKIIIPPIGTTLQDVETVYGQAHVEYYNGNRNVKRAYGDEPKLNLKEKINVNCSISLLPIAWQTKEETVPRATLYFFLANGKIDESDINFLRVGKGRKQLGFFATDPKIKAQQEREYEKVRRELDWEERGVLKDLLQIQMRYASNLKTAVWNLPKTRTK